MVLLQIIIGVSGVAFHIAHCSASGKARQRSKPYYTEMDVSAHEQAVFGFDTLKDAVDEAKRRTVGYYNVTGRLNDNHAEVYERGGKLVETVRSGFTESEYKKVKAENEMKAKEEEKRKEEEKKRNAEERRREENLMAFRWNSSNIR